MLFKGDVAFEFLCPEIHLFVLRTTLPFAAFDAMEPSQASMLAERRA